jgi:general secretion pathway protein J
MARKAKGSLAGFTLIELMVALAIMAMLSILAWRALDGMRQSSSITRTHTDAALALEAGLGQWGADLGAVIEVPQTVPMDWDGRVLRITRRHSADAAQGVVVVAWSAGNRGGNSQWLRWQSDPVRDRAQWLDAWNAAAQWAQSPSDAAKTREVQLAPVTQWQIFFSRGGAWSNPLSSSGAPANGVAPALIDSGTNAPPPDPLASSIPDGVRLQLTIASPHPMAGRVTRDWALPTLGPLSQ